MRLVVALMIILASSMTMAETVLKISTLYPPGTEAVTTLKALGKELSAQTNGEVSLKVYPGGVMGDDSTVIRKIRIGQLHGALVSGTALDMLTKDLKDLSQPFQFNTLDDVYEQRLVHDGVFRDRLSEKGWASFGPLDGGFSYLMSKQPIEDMAALRAAKLWLPNTSDIQQLSKQMNVNYLVMGIGDVLTGLDTGAIDTLVSPPSAALALNWHSRFEYFTDTPVIYTFGMLILPEKVLKRVPSEHQAQVRSLLTKWSDELDQSMRLSNARAFVALQQLLKSKPFSLQDIQAMRLSQR